MVCLAKRLCSDPGRPVHAMPCPHVARGAHLWSGVCHGCSGQLCSVAELVASGPHSELGLFPILTRLTGLSTPHSNLFVIMHEECLGLGSPRGFLETEIWIQGEVTAGSTDGKPGSESGGNGHFLEPRG